MHFLLGLSLFLPIMDGWEKNQEDDPIADAKLTEKYREAYKKGTMEAEEEIKAGVVTLYTYGLRMSLDHVDRETGLPFEPIAACVVNDEIYGRAEGHNEAVKEHIKLHGLPANSFKAWEKDLFDLKAFFARESKKVPPIPLKVGGPVLKSPDGKYTIRPVQIESKDDKGKVRQSLGFVLEGEARLPTTKQIFWDEGETELLWGPKGSRFLVIRCKTSHRLFSFHYQAFDLQRGELLRSEHQKVQ